MTAQSYQRTKPRPEDAPTIGYLYRTRGGYAVTWRCPHESTRHHVLRDTPDECERAFYKAVPDGKLVKGMGIG